MFERAFQGYEKALGLEHLSTLKVVSNLGLLAMKEGRLEEAERYQQALEGCKKSPGILLAKTYIPALDALENIGQLYASTGRSEKAREMNKRALNDVDMVFGRSSQRYSKLSAVIASFDEPVDVEPLSLES